MKQQKVTLTDLIAFASGELTGPAAAMVEAYLAGVPEAARAARRLQEVIDTLRTDDTCEPGGSVFCVSEVTTRKVSSQENEARVLVTGHIEGLRQAISDAPIVAEDIHVFATIPEGRFEEGEKVDLCYLALVLTRHECATVPSRGDAPMGSRGSEAELTGTFRAGDSGLLAGRL